MAGFSYFCYQLILRVNFSAFHKNISQIKWIYIFVVFILPLVYIGCNNSSRPNYIAAPDKNERKIDIVTLLIGNGNNFFRSVELGADTQTVLHSEKRIPDENDTGDISYSMPVDTLHPDSVSEPIDSVNYFTITYYFDKGKLNEIDEDIFLANDTAAANIMGRLTDYLNSKYGDYASQNDSRVWSTTRNGKKQWVTLSDQSEEYDYGKLLLVFYSEEY